MFSVVFVLLVIILVQMVLSIILIMQMSVKVSVFSIMLLLLLLMLVHNILNLNVLPFLTLIFIMVMVRKIVFNIFVLVSRQLWIWLIIWKLGIFSFLGLSYSYQNYQYKPWLNDEDSKNVFFASLHGYGKLTPTSVDYFYPGSGHSINKVDYVPQNITRTLFTVLILISLYDI